MRYVIIGCSAAGVNAAAAIRAADPAGEILLLTREDADHYSRPMLSYYLASRSNEEQLLYRGKSYLDHLSAVLRTNTHVVGLDVKVPTVHCADGSSIACDRLLIASGGVARQPDIPGIDLDGVFHLRTLAHARAIKEWASRTQVCVTLGGGLVSLKAAEALIARGVKEVHLVVGSDRVMSQALDREGAKFLSRRLARNNVYVHTGQSVTAIFGDEQRDNSAASVRGVSLRNGLQIACQMVLVGKGVRPDLALTKGTGMATDYGILVNERMETSLPHIYAAGDVAQAHDLVHDQPQVNALWPLAARQGWTAGSNMAGQTVAYRGWFAMNSLQLFGLPVISMGLVSAEADGNFEVLVHADPSKETYRKLVLRQDRLVGCAIIGDTDASCLAGLIRTGVSVSSFKEQLALRGVPDYRVVATEKGSERAKGLRSIIVRLDRCLHCRSCELACAVSHSDHQHLVGALGTHPLRRIRLRRYGSSFVPLSCHHCTDAPCVYACISGVRRQTPEGIQTEESLCVGCGSCYMVCPVGAISRHVASGRLASCDRCGDRQPACVTACPTRALELVEGQGGPGFYLCVRNEETEVQR